MTTGARGINAERLASDIHMLREYVDSTEIEPMLAVLDALQQDPGSEPLFIQFKQAFAALGIVQGAVLTYAPYINILLLENPFDSSQED